MCDKYVCTVYMLFETMLGSYSYLLSWRVLVRPTLANGAAQQSVCVVASTLLRLVIAQHLKPRNIGQYRVGDWSRMYIASSMQALMVTEVGGSCLVALKLSRQRVMWRLYELALLCPNIFASTQSFHQLSTSQCSNFEYKTIFFCRVRSFSLHVHI